MRKSILIGLALLAVGATAAAVVFRPDKGLRVVTAFVSHTLCSETFVAGLDPDQTYRETFHDWPVVRRLLPVVRYEVDGGHREVRATLGGAFASRAVYRNGLGCVQAPAGSPAPDSAAPGAAAPDANAPPTKRSPSSFAPATATNRSPGLTVRLSVLIPASSSAEKRASLTASVVRRSASFMASGAVYS